MKLMGVVWLALAVAFVLSAAATMLGWRAALPLAAGSVAISLVACAISLPEARIGLVLNLMLALFLALGPKAGLDVYHDGEATSPHEGVVR
jgi:hypothetical protein